MKRTTIGLDDELFRELKARAAREGTTLGRLVNDLLWAAARPAAKKPYVFHLPVSRRGGGLLPGVCLEDKQSLRDIMDGLKNPGDP